MNTTNTIQKLGLATFSLAALSGTAIAFSPATAHADGVDRGSGALLSVAGSNTWESGTYSKTLTFTLSTTNPAPAGAKGGNVEFEWKVEEGES